MAIRCHHLAVVLLVELLDLGLTTMTTAYADVAAFLVRHRDAAAAGDGAAAAAGGDGGDSLDNGYVEVGIVALFLDNEL